LTKNTRFEFIKWLQFVALINDFGLFANKIPYACGAPFGASSTRANKVRSTPIYRALGI
jgi:hypothetical protein